MDGGARGSADGGRVAPTDASAATPQPDPVLERGRYLVHHVAACPECHTPRGQLGFFDEDMTLAGVANLVDLDPDDEGRGLLHAPNLTPDDETGLGEWTPREIKRAFQHGESRDGRVLHWFMPHWVFHGMTEADADAVVIYLRSLPPRRNAVPERQPLPPGHVSDEPYHLPHDALPETTLPEDHPDRASAERGHYLATAVAFCVLCHSPEAADPRAPLDVTRIFAGRRMLRPERLGTPDEFDLGDIRIMTRNLTPHALALGPWDPGQVADTLRFGITRDGLPVCDPMPSVDGAAFRGMTEPDALDVAHYLLSIPAIDSGAIDPCCATCHGDGGDADAGM